MAPMLQRNYNIQGLFTYTQMFLKIAHFGIKTQVMGEQPENLSEQDLRHLRKLDADCTYFFKDLNFFTIFSEYLARASQRNLPFKAKGPVKKNPGEIYPDH